MFKQDLYFSKPIMNAAGTLGFAPDFRAPVPWDEFGAFVTNPISLRPRLPTVKPALIEYPGGTLLHTGLPNPGLYTVVDKYAPRWADSRLPVVVHLMADRPEETERMIRLLENLENIMAVELGFAPLLSEDIILTTIGMALGELPLVVSLSMERVLALGARVFQRGAMAISLAAPRGMVILENGEQVTGRVCSAGLFPQALLTVRDAVRSNLPVIGAGGVQSRENADAMLSVGAMAVQMDESLWRGNITLSVSEAKQG